MSRTCRPTVLAAWALAAGAAIAPAQSALIAPPEETPPAFLLRWDTRGDAFHLAEWTSRGYRLLTAAEPSLAAALPPPDFALLVAPLGLDRVTSLALTSRPGSAGWWDNRLECTIAPGAGGLPDLFASAPVPFTLGDFGPAESSLAWEADLPLARLSDLARNLAYELAGESGRGLVGKALGRPLGPLPFSWRDLTMGGPTRLQGWLWWERAAAAGDGATGTAATLRWALRLPGAAGFLEQFRGTEKTLPRVQVYAGPDFYQLAFPLEAAPPATRHLVFRARQEERDLWISSRAEDVERALAPSAQLGASPAFREAVFSLPSAGSGLLYLDPAWPAGLRDWLALQPATTTRRVALVRLLDLGLDAWQHPGATAWTFETELLTIRQRAGFSWESPFYGALLAGPALAAREVLPEVLRRRQDRENEAIRANLHLLVDAGRRLLEDGREEVGWEDLVGPGRPLADLTGVAGEDYRAIRLSPETREVSVTTEDGRTVSLRRHEVWR